MLQLLEEFTIETCMCLFVTEVLCYSESAPVYDLLTVGAVA